MRKGVRLWRSFPEFQVSMEWYGGMEVVVVGLNGSRLYSVPLKSAGPRTASEVMNLEREEMHNSCQAFS